MDDLQRAPAHQLDLYHCPGESHPIDRATHLGRLAAFYPACRNCRHRDDIGQLTPEEVQRWEEVLRREGSQPRFTAEGFAAGSLNHLDGRLVARFATALTAYLWHSHPRSHSQPVVLVGTDGHWSTAELMAAACGAVELTGCRAVEAGALTVPCLANLARHLQSDAALWIGNASGQPHALELRVAGPGGRPWSSPGGLDEVREIFGARVSRPRRRGGSRDRAGGERGYLEPLRRQFHALRPLRFVLDTTCRPLVRYLESLTADAACRVLRPAVVGNSRLEHAAAADASYVERRQRTLAQNVLAEQAHFGVWIDGAGESCRLTDENGTPVHGERLFELCVSYVLQQQPEATIVLEPGASDKLQAALARAGARILRARATRQAMYDAIETAGAAFGLAPDGAIWYSGEPPLCDGLMTVNLLLTILSQSDRSVSEVLDAV